MSWALIINHRAFKEEISEAAPSNSTHGAQRRRGLIQQLPFNTGKLKQRKETECQDPATVAGCAFRSAALAEEPRRSPHRCAWVRTAESGSRRTAEGSHSQGRRRAPSVVTPPGGSHFLVGRVVVQLSAGPDSTARKKRAEPSGAATEFLEGLVVEMIPLSSREKNPWSPPRVSPAVVRVFYHFERSNQE